MNAIGLGLDTTFDDTSAAILRGTREVLANLTLSQYRDHKEFGGVVPERASRKHLEVIHPLIREALAKALVGPGRERSEGDREEARRCPSASPA